MVALTTSRGTVAQERGLLTLALGDDRVRTMAHALGLSLGLHSPSLPRVVVVDRPDERLSRSFDRVVVVEPSRLAASFESKLELDRLAPFEETLFLDADCLVVHDIEPHWGLFRGMSVGVVARILEQPGQIFPMERLPAEFWTLDFLPLFNGGAYFLRSGPETTAIFDEARRIADHYEAWGLTLLNGRRNEEPAIGLALAAHGQRGVDDSGDPLMRSLVGVESWIDMDVLAGRSRFTKGDDRVEPAVVHFAGRLAKASSLYRRELLTLELVDRSLRPGLARRLAHARHPLAGGSLAKAALRARCREPLANRV